MDLGLSGKRVLVTGGASGLGAALVRTLVEEGARVCLNYRSRRDEADALVTELSDESQTNIVAVQADLSDMQQVRNLFTEATKQLGGLDAVVNNAGIWLTCQIPEITEDEWDKTMDVNLKAPMILTQMLVKHCQDEGKPGVVLSVTSQAAFRGSSTGHMPYAASKGGLISMTRSLVQEMKDCGVRFNTLAIGTMESPMIAQALAARREFYESRIPIGYVAKAEQVAAIAAFLVSDKADYITGACIDVSGGQLLH